MAFRLRVDAERWFKHINDKAPLKTKFDIYYLCLLLGLASRRTSTNDKQLPKSSFIDNFVKEYKPYSHLILGLLLRAEVFHYSYDLDDRSEVMKVLKGIADPQGISTKGIMRLNEYASGGFDLLQEKFGGAPYSIEDFLVTYVEILQEAVEKEDTWHPISSP